MATSNGRAIPDGAGGALYPGLNLLYHFTGSGTSTFASPITSSPQTFGTDGQDPLLLGKDGTVYIAGYNSAGNDSLAALDSSGTVKWTVSSPGKSPRLSTVMADGSVVFQSMQADDAMHVLIADSNGNVSPLFASATDGSDIGPAVPNPFYYAPALFQLNNASYWTSSTWHVPDGSGSIDFISGPISGPGSEADCSAWTSAGGEPQRQSVGNPTATITVNFSGPLSAGDNLVFTGVGTCGNTLGLRTCPKKSWLVYIEGVATVSDDASKWTVHQHAVELRSGFWTNTQGTLHFFQTFFNSSIISGDDDPCAPNDSRSDCQGVVSVQQQPGQKKIFWTDVPGSLYQYDIAPLPGDWIDSLHMNGQFTSKVCNRFLICQSVPWFISIVVDPGSNLDLSLSSCGLSSGH